MRRRRNRHKPSKEELQKLLEEAANPATPTARLRELVAYGAPVKRAVAKNPNTYTSLLLWLAPRYWREVLENPMLPLLLLEDPGFPAQWPVRALREILRLPAPPPEFLPPLLRHSNPEIRESARLHRANSQNIQTAPTPELEVRGGAGLMELLALDLAPDWVVEAALESAQGPLRARARRLVFSLADSPVQERLSWLREAGADKYLQHVGAGKPDMAPEKLEALARGGPFARRLAARHPNTPPELLATLAELRQEDRIRRSVASNPSTPTATLFSLASTGDAAVRVAVARNPSCPPPLLDTLSRDTTTQVRAATAKNRACPPKTLAQLANDAEKDVRRNVAANRNTEAATLKLLGKDSDKDVRENVAKRRGTPVAVLRELIKDSEWDVGYAAAKNSALPGSPRIRLLRFIKRKDETSPPVDAPATPEEIERERVFALLRGNDTPESLWKEVAQHHDVEVRRVLAWRKPPTAVAILLAHDPSPEVRLAVSTSPTLPLEERLKLAEDPDPRIRAHTLRAGDMPLEYFERFSQDESEEARLQVLHSGHAPDSILIRMAQTETSPRVLDSLFHRMADENDPDEMLLTLLERCPEAPKKMVWRSNFSPRFLEALLLHLDGYTQSQLLQAQNYNRRRSKSPPIPTDLLLKFCEAHPDDQYGWATREKGRATVVNYWAVTPEALEAVARMELALPNSEDRMDRYLARRQKTSGGTLGIIAAHPRTPPHILAELLEHISPKVRVAAFDNHNTPPEAKEKCRETILRAAAKRTPVLQRVCALSNPQTAPDILEKFARQGRWMERYAVARNPALGRELLETLRDDSNVAVAGAARENLAARFDDA